ncbi:ribokinase [Athalassotoga saccharophila]|uniref:ribokinase n=1 Tax=Athalassotoga saccharophila TaxID=1441386 RepID=UPI001379EE2E|nr:ribokinase [Athalassotoga saccharophila]BBJ27578.1 ribokinase [Athalassotoga saccharophila]
MSIAVLGSINVDLVSFTKRFPDPGETIRGDGFEIHQGGKGANQAVAAAKSGGDVFMLGAVGKDIFGDFLIDSLKKSGVKTERISKFEGTSGVASIWVDGNGENSIILDGGANDKIDKGFVEKNFDIVRRSDFLLIQFEISKDVVGYAARLAHDLGVKVILDPAPAFQISDDILKCVDYITPNEIEITQIVDGKNLKERIIAIEKMGPKVIVKAGRKGVYILKDGEILNLKAFRVNAVDTTGAGDCFNGTLAVGLSEGKALEMACYFAMAASAISVTRRGAGSSFPSRKEIEEFLKTHET